MDLHEEPRMSSQDRLAQAHQPAEEAMRLHPFYRGKLQVMPKCPVRGFGDFSLWYTPGVAAPCRARPCFRPSVARSTG